MRAHERVKKQIGHHAGSVLMKLHFYIGLNVSKGRKPSTAVGMQKLADECALSFFQARRTVGKLRRDGFIRTEQHMFGGRNLNSYVLTIKAEELISGSFEQTTSGSLEQCSETSEQNGTGTLPQTGPGTLEDNGSGSLYSKIENLDTEEDIEFPQPPPGASEITAETGTETETLSIPPVDFPSPQSPPPQNEVEMPHSVHDVQGLVAAQKKVHKPDSTAALGKAWQIGMKEHVPNQMVVLNQKDYAHLKQFAKHCEPGTAEAILHFTLSEWIAFTKFCEQEAGAFKTPGTPTLQFLVKFAQQAVTFYLQAKKKPAMATPSVNPKPVPTQLIAGQEPMSKTVSPEQVFAPYDPDADYED